MFTEGYHIISYHITYTFTNAPLGQCSTAPYNTTHIVLFLKKILIEIKSSMKQESLEMFLECCLATTITNVNWQ